MHWVGFLTGLILWTLLPAWLVAAIAAIYNRLVD
jgi:hypothetical protein